MRTSGFTLTELFTRRGSPTHMRSDNGSEFTAKDVRLWLRDLGVKTLFIEPGSPWENGYNESLNGTLGGGSAEAGGLFDSEGSDGSHRTMAARVEHHPAPQFAGLSATSARGDQARSYVLESPGPPGT